MKISVSINLLNWNSLQRPKTINYFISIFLFTDSVLIVTINDVTILFYTISSIYHCFNELNFFQFFEPILIEFPFVNTERGVFPEVCFLSKASTRSEIIISLQLIYCHVLRINRLQPINRFRSWTWRDGWAKLSWVRSKGHYEWKMLLVTSILSPLVPFELESAFYVTLILWFSIVSE